MVVPGLIISFSECFSPTLEQFSVSFVPDLYMLEGEEIPADPRFALSFDMFTPLLSFSRLIKVDLDWICASAIDDASLKTTAQSWPLLQEFYLGSGCGWLVPPSLTFIGFIHLIQHCRGLRKVDMTFCACPVDTNIEPFSKTIPNENVTEIFVGTSPIVDAVAVACQLHTLVPKLTGVNRFDDFADDIEEGWDNVNEFLMVLNAGAKMRESVGRATHECPDTA